MRVHFIVDGVVVNSVEQDSLDNPFGFLAVADDNAGPGWLYDGNTFTPPTPSNEQAQARLNQLVQNSYKTRLRGKAATLSKSGDVFGAAKLLIKASEV